MYGRDPRVAAMKAARRSYLRYQIGAVLYNPATGKVEEVGWNHSLPANRNLKYYFTWHAEFHVIARASLNRVQGWTLTIYGQAKKSGNRVLAKPCHKCEALCREARIARIEYSTKAADEWAMMVQRGSRWKTV